LGRGVGLEFCGPWVFFLFFFLFFPPILESADEWAVEREREREMKKRRERKGCY
jgi:hypothetical protein